MITIENINSIEQKPLGKKNFYVARVEQSNLMNPYTFQREQRYIFELSNRKYAITVILNRNSHNGNTYELKSSNGYTHYISVLDIRNVDKFLDKLRFVALG